MTEQLQYRYELYLKVAGPLLVLAGLIFGVYQYQDTARLDREARDEQYKKSLVEAQREAKKPFYEKQLALYLEATNVTSRISTPISEEDKNAAIVRFGQLYWGQLVLVEDQKVATAMIAFKKALENTTDSEEEKAENLKRKTIELARKCRESLKESWEVDELTAIAAKE